MYVLSMYSIYRNGDNHRPCYKNFRNLKQSDEKSSHRPAWNILSFPWSTVSHKYSELAVITEGVRSDVATSSLTPTGCLKERKRGKRLEWYAWPQNLLRKIKKAKPRSKFGTPTLCYENRSWDTPAAKGPTGRKHNTVP